MYGEYHTFIFMSRSFLKKVSCPSPVAPEKAKQVSQLILRQMCSRLSSESLSMRK